MRFIYPISLVVVLFAEQLVVAADQQATAAKGDTASGWSLLSIASAVIALVALALFGRWFLVRQAQRGRHDPGQLLRELCKTHGLSRRVERLLKKAAAAVGTPHPARFFLEPKLLRQAEECVQLKRSKRAISLLYDRLFGEDVI
jgi:hypothetical protein